MYDMPVLVLSGEVFVCRGSIILAVSCVRVLCAKNTVSLKDVNVLDLL